MTHQTFKKTSLTLIISFLSIVSSVQAYNPALPKAVWEGYPEDNTQTKEAKISDDSITTENGSDQKKSI